MSLRPWFDWLEHSALSTAVHAGSWQFPASEILHIAGAIVVFGSVLIVNLRLLGRIFTQVPAASVAADLRTWNRVGLVAQFATGLLLLSAEATRFYDNTPFRIKAALLVLALLFQATVHRRTIEDAQGRRGRAAMAAVVSLALWFGVLIAGMSIELFG